MATKPALIKFYARLVRKDQMKIEEIDPEIREEVRTAIAQYDAEEENKNADD